MTEPRAMPTASTAADVEAARALVRRYLDATARWSAADDARLRALCRGSAEAAAVYDRAVVRHRALLGAPLDRPSGLELRRMIAATTEAAGHPATGTAPGRLAARWLAALGALAATALAVLIARPTAPAGDPPDADDWIAARGLPAADLPDRRAGLGVGAVTDDGREYEAIASREVHLDDWLRLSFTNERADLGWLFVLALQPERPPAERVVWVAPTPDEARSLPVPLARFRQLPFEIRLASRHALGPVRFVALFTSQPLDLAAVARALDPEAAAALPSRLEPLLRERLQLSPRDVVQVMETRIVSGSAAGTLPAPPGKEATPP